MFANRFLSRVCPSFAPRAMAITAQPFRQLSSMTSVEDKDAIESGKDFNQSILVSLTGRDRIDLIHNLHTFVADNKGFIDQSRMGMFGTDFGMLASVTIPDNIDIKDFHKSCKQKFPDFCVTMRNVGPAHQFENQNQIVFVDGEGPDQPNVATKLTKVFHDHGVSVRDFQSHTTAAPFSGYNIFSVRAVCSVPMTTDSEAFTDAILEYETETGLTIELSQPQLTNEEESSEEEDDDDKVNHVKDVVEGEVASKQKIEK